MQSFAYHFHITAAFGAAHQLYVGTYRNSDLNEPDNCIRALDPNYREIWRRPVDFTPVEIVATDSRVLALTYNIYTSGGILYCLDALIGELVWSKKLRSLSSASELLPIGDNVICFGDTEIVSYAIKNGKRTCAAKLGSFLPPKLTLSAILCCSNGSLTQLRSHDLKPNWTVETSRSPRAFGCNTDHVFVRGDEGNLRIYDLKTGEQSGEIQSEAFSAVLCDLQTIFFQSEHDNNRRYVISCYGIGNRKALWKSSVPISPGDALYSPQVEILTDRVLIARANVGPVYALDKLTGNLTMLLSEADIPGHKFPTQNSPPLFLFQERLCVQYGRTVFVLAQFPSDFFGTTILDADKESWRRRTL